jgi:2-keto-4-pentenoate hydratase/2-oxohepta-3-ene-1,7-dioic acid hydratase in catechol pathway
MTRWTTCSVTPPSTTGPCANTSARPTSGRRARNFDGTGALGPVVVTQDEVPEGASGLKIQTRLNGEVLQNSDTSDMIFTVRRTIAIVSEIMTLEPGDMIAFGTPPGVGHARKPPVWMKAGDVVEVEIEGIGICRNPIVAETDLAQRAAAE